MMEKNLIEQWAVESGFRTASIDDAQSGSRTMIFSVASSVTDEIYRFAALVAAHEREQCAELCEQWDASHPRRLAAAIRARGEVTPPR